MIRKYLLISLLSFIAIINIQAQEEKYIGLFVYNFTKYYDWPVDAKTTDFRIQVMGHKSVYEELVRLTKGKSVGHQPIIVEHITTSDQINTTGHMLFMGHWQTRQLQAVTEKIAGKPILLITEFEGMLDKGSAINFIVREGKIKFEINTTIAANLGLKIDPRLRQLAYSVVQ